MRRDPQRHCQSEACKARHRDPLTLPPDQTGKRRSGTVPSSDVRVLMFILQIKCILLSEYTPGHAHEGP